MFLCCMCFVPLDRNIFFLILIKLVINKKSTEDLIFDSSRIYHWIKWQGTVIQVFVK